jgi:hypothetical protein
MKFFNTLAAFSFAAALCSSAQAITLGQVDDFQDGTLQAWDGGPWMNNIPNGGPNGAGDRYLEVESRGGSGPGSRLATYNTLQWSGNYTAAGVKTVEMHLKNMSSQSIHMRAVIFGPGQATQWTSSTAVIIPANSDWVRVSFILSPSTMVRVAGSDSFATCMADVTRFMIRHNVNASSGGDPFVGFMGVDNVTAVAGPTVFPNALLMLTGFVQSGNIDSLRFQDNDRLIMREAPPVALGAPSIDVRIDGTSPVATIATMRLRVVTSTSGAPASAVTQVIQMFNYSTNVFETVDTRQGTASDNVILINPTGDPNRFIEPGTRRVRIRVRWFDPGTLFSFGWVGRINQVNWELGL